MPHNQDESLSEFPQLAMRMELLKKAERQFFERFSHFPGTEDANPEPGHEAPPSLEFNADTRAES